MPHEGWYRPLPPPFVGGRQPAEPPPHVTPPVSVDEPPFGHPMRLTATVMTVVVMEWQAENW